MPVGDAGIVVEIRPSPDVATNNVLPEITGADGMPKPKIPDC
jgi:hypothetical protein